MTHYRKGHRVRRRPILAEEMEGTDELFGHDGFTPQHPEDDEPLAFISEMRPPRADEMKELRGSKVA